MLLLKKLIFLFFIRISVYYFEVKQVQWKSKLYDIMTKEPVKTGIEIRDQVVTGNPDTSTIKGMPAYVSVVIRSNVLKEFEVLT